MKKIFMNKKGNALLTAVVAFSVLLVISMCLAALSVTNINLSKKSKEYNNTYYTAEAAVQKGLQQLKDKISEYYKEIQDIAVASGYTSEYTEKYSNFYTNIVSNAQSAFTEPVFSENTYTSAVTDTEFSVENIDITTHMADLVVESTATLADGTERTVRGVLSVPKISVLVQGSSWYDATTNALTVGASLALRNNFNDQITVVNGNARFGAIDNRKTPFTQVVMVNGTYQVTPGLGNTISNSVRYSTLAQRRITEYTKYITSSSGPTPADVTSPPTYLEGAPDVSYKIQNLSVTGQAYCNGDLTIKSCTFVGDIYCDGNVDITSCTIRGNIFAGGNVNISDTTFTGEYVVDTTVDGAIFAGGSIDIDRATANNCILYAAVDMYVKSCTIVGVTFTGNNTVIHNDLSFVGAMTAKNNLNFDNNGNRYFSLTYSPYLVSGIRNNEMYSAFFNTVTYEMTDLSVDDIINKEQIYEK